MVRTGTVGLERQHNYGSCVSSVSSCVAFHRVVATETTNPIHRQTMAAYEKLTSILPRSEVLL